MQDTGALDTGLIDNIGLWLGFLMTLAILSLVIADNALARLAQHILVGASLGYAAALVWRDVLLPRLFSPLLADPGANSMLWFPLILGLLMWAAGAERLFRARSRDKRDHAWRKWLELLGAAPVALMMGMVIGVAVTGALQGTLLPQFARAAETGIDTAGTAGTLLTGILTLMLTSGALLHLFADADQLTKEQPRWIRATLSAWLWLGKRGVWFAAGLIFARLMAARFSLLIARTEYLIFTLTSTGLWKWAESVWQSLLQ